MSIGFLVLRSCVSSYSTIAELGTGCCQDVGSEQLVMTRTVIYLHAANIKSSAGFIVMLSYFCECERLSGTVLYAGIFSETESLLSLYSGLVRAGVQSTSPRRGDWRQQWLCVRYRLEITDDLWYLESCTHICWRWQTWSFILQKRHICALQNLDYI